MRGDLLTRKQAAEYMRTAFALRTTPASLDTMASRGGGPPYLKIGRYVSYRRSDLDAWAASRCSGLLDSTSSARGKDTDGLFEWIDMDDLTLDTGQPAFDEVTKLLREETELQELLESAGTKYDQQFS